MTPHSVELIGFENDHTLNDILSGFRLLADYKSVLPQHFTEVLRKQHSNVQLHSLELLGTPNCELGGMPSPENPEHIIVETIKVPLDLRIRLTTTGQDLHELDVTLIIKGENVHKTPQVTTDMLIRDHRAIS